ncbi:MAG: class I SAM-dependent methyltransferase [Gemmatimonas sp.]
MDLTHPYGSLQLRWRRERMQACVDLLGITNETRVLDVGGDAFNWNLIDTKPRLTLLNVFGANTDLPPHMEWVIGDGCNLQYGNGEYDVVFSNSVIEHLGTEERQRAFASEAMRVGKSYFVQTPNRRFPIEPHLIAPFVHYLPRKWQRPLYPYTGWGLLSRPSAKEMDAQFAELRLLSEREMRNFFPRARLKREKVGGLVKSLIAYELRNN